MTRVTAGRALVGGQPDTRALTLRVPCEVCDAGAGKRCQVWRTHKGERLYVKGVRVKFHDQRIVAAGAKKGVA